MRRHALTLLLVLLAARAEAQQIVFLTQENCPPCVTAHRNADPLAAELRINTVDCWSDLGKQICQRYNVPRTPTFLAIDANGNCVDRVDGVATQSRLRVMAGKFAKVQAVAVSKQTPHCRINVGDGSAGSGTLVDKRDGKGLVLTCSHLFDDSTEGIRVTFADGKSYVASLAERDSKNDVAALVIPEPAANPAPICEDEPQGKLTAGGYGSDRVFKTVCGEIVGQATPVGATYPSTMIRGSVRSGDSGGGVFDSRGEFVGVIWGTRDGVTYASCGQPVRRLLDRVFPNRPGKIVPRQGGPVSPVPVSRQSGGSAGGMQPPRQDIDPRPPLEPVQPVPLPPIQNPPLPSNPGPGDSACNCREKWLSLNQTIFDLRQQIVELSAKQELDIVATNTRIDNHWKSVGDRVTNIDNRITELQNSDLALNYEQIAAETAKRFQPLNLKIDDPRGGAYSTDYKQWQIRTLDQPAQYVRLPFQPVTPAK